jgi:O-antigen/teichoic acid export membrane protein
LRGELAAIIVPLALVPAILDIGLTTFVARERARGTPRDVLLGTVVPVSLGISIIGMIAAYPLAQLLAQGRSTAMTFLFVGFMLSPLTVALQTMLGVPVGEGRWKLISYIRIAAPAMTLASFVVLYAAGALTVATAAATVLSAGVLANLPLLGVFREARSWRYDGRLARTGLRFGSQIWVGTVSGAAGARLDQLLMVPLVPSRELGLYAVAVTTAGFAGVFVGAMGLALTPQASRGNQELVRRSARITALVLVGAAIAMAIAVPVLLPLLFGSDFGDAVPMAWVLLLSTVTSGIAVVLNVGLAGSGHPGLAARALIIPLIVATPVMIVALPSTGGLGAAWISTGGSILGLALFVRYTKRTSGADVRDILLPTRADFRDLTDHVRRIVRRPNA